MRRPSTAVITIGIGALVSGLGLAPVAAAAAPTAHLVRVDVFHPAQNGGNGHGGGGGGGGGHGGPPAPTTANCSPDGATHGQYDTIGHETAGRPTTLVTASLPVIKTAASASTGPDVNAGTDDVLAAMQGAFDAWSAADHAAPSITVQANSSSTQTRQAADRADELLFGRVSGSAIAVTYTWLWSDGLIEHDTVFSNKLGWAMIPDSDPSVGCYENWPLYDVQDIATHEFGHTYGLGHAQTDRFETMYVYGYTGENSDLKRTLGNGDDAGIKSVY